MSHPSKPKKYRQVIDELLDMSVSGAGQVNVHRVRDGSWSRIDPNEEPMGIPEVDDAFARLAEANNEVADLISRLSVADRRVIARMLSDQVFTGVFETLKILEAHKVAPFEDGYEGSPFDDLVEGKAGHGPRNEGASSARPNA